MKAKTFKELQSIVDFIIANKLPRKHLMILTHKEKMEWDMFLKCLGSSCVLSSKIDGTEIECDKIKYAAVEFTMVSTGYVEEEPHLHDWKEAKAHIEGQPNRYILSRFCNNCGATQTFVDNRWCDTGYLKDCSKEDSVI